MQNGLFLLRNLPFLLSMCTTSGCRTAVSVLQKLGSRSSSWRSKMSSSLATFSPSILSNYIQQTDQCIISFIIAVETKGVWPHSQQLPKYPSLSFLMLKLTSLCACKISLWSRYVVVIDLIFVSFVRYSLLHFHLSRMAVHHHLLHHLHYHHLHLFLLVQFFILNLRLGLSANPFLLRPFPFLPDWFHGLSEHLMFLLCSTAGFDCMVC